MKNNVAPLLLQKYGKKNPPQLRSGDTIRVHQRIKEGEKERIQIFEGLVIATKHGAGLDGTFTVRKIAAGGIGVERVFPLHSPNVLKVERIKSAEVSRSKLYYMRDRLGKAARFKSEVRTPEEWIERAAVAEMEAIEEAAAEVNAEAAEERAEEAEEAAEAEEKAEKVEEATEAKEEEAEKAE